ncbi:MAG: response regulator transcription factor [Planctomycetales bacterium]|nr:response regulator transcription factor [Planctomycetales bacterium]
MNKHRIMIIDDHPLMRAGLRGLIEAESDMEVCCEASTAQEAMVGLREQTPDMAIVDISLSDSNGLELLKRIRSRNDDIKTIVVSMYEATMFAERALRAGAMGYVNKEEAVDVVVDAIRTVLAGSIYVDAETNKRLLWNMSGRSPSRDSDPIGQLSDRELEVFALLGKGQSTRDIANGLKLSVKTIESYRENIKTKIGVKTASELMRHAVQWVLENG